MPISRRLARLPEAAMSSGPPGREAQQEAWNHLAPDILMYGNWYCHIAQIGGALYVRRLDPTSLRRDADGSAWIRVAAAPGEVVPGA